MSSECVECCYVNEMMASPLTICMRNSARNYLNFLTKKHDQMKLKSSHMSIVNRYSIFIPNKLTGSKLSGNKLTPCLKCNGGISDYRLYSDLKSKNEKKSTDIKGLADELLKVQVQKSEDKSDGSQEQRDKDEQAKSDEFSKRAMKYSFIAFSTLFAGSVVLIIMEWGAPQKAEDGTFIKDDLSEMNVVKQYLLRTYREFLQYDKMIKEPSREKLLPEPLKEPYIQPPYTLVLEMKGVLVHPNWTYQTGWRFQKRPGIDFFLQQAGPPLFEVVIYTSEQGFTAFPIIDNLDPNGHIMYRLFRDATRYIDGHHVKDLSCLNRDLSRVIMIDCDEKSVQTNKENSLVLKKWTGDNNDRDLMDLAMFLRTIAKNEVEDVRSVLQFYSQFEDPIAAFKENQRRLNEETEEKVRIAQTQNPSLAKSWTNSFRK